VQPEARVIVPPFSEHVDGDDVIIANPARGVFLAVPPEAAVLLRLLASGQTVAEAGAAYAAQYGQPADIADFVESLTAAGFLDAPPAAPVGTRRYHFASIPVGTARRLWSRPALAVCGALIGLGLLACASEPAIVPSPAALVFDPDHLGLSLVLIALALGAVFVHELAHLLAARAAGVPARLGIGTRLWELVAETDMTGIWLASRRQRCLAFVAGMLADLTLAALLALLLLAHQRAWLGLDLNLVLLARALLFVQLTRLLWELYIFVPTDVYYVLATLTGCRNLMGDTQAWLLNWCWRLVRRPQRIDQSGVPARELRVVRIFAWVWLVGRGLAFASLFFITLPVLAAYLAMLGRGLGGDANPLRPLLEGPALPLLAVGVQLAGIVLWLRGLLRARGHMV